MTDWAQLVDTNSPLPEYPRPQMVRTNWLNLNGIWQFQAGAINDPVPTNQTLAREILVPFPMESALSGIQEYHDRSWYRRTFTVPAGWSGNRIFCTWMPLTGSRKFISMAPAWEFTGAVMIR